MNILVFNIGSSTIKYSVYSGENKVLGGLIDNVKSYSSGLNSVEAIVKRKKIKIDAVGHRVVHGGSTKQPQKITKATIKLITDNIKLAPLHNPHNLQGIIAAMKVFKVPHVAVFDTAFHSSIPAVAHTYAIPKKYRDKYSIRRYGFHGISHEYVYLEACKKLKKRPSSVKAITCHLGNGCSITAIDKGKSIDTSMGFTPLEGLVMGTRSGDIDPAIIDFLVRNEKLSSSKVTEILNKKSGLLGLSGRTNDMRKLIKSRSKESKLAIDIFFYKIIKYIGAYATVMNGADVIVFTAGIGENEIFMRKHIKDRLRFLKAKIMFIPTREGLMIAKQTKKLIK